LLLALVLPPVYLSVLNIGGALGIIGWSFVMAVDSLLTMLVSRTSISVGEALSSVIFWDVVVALFGVGFSWWTIWICQRHAIGVANTKPSLGVDLGDAQPAVEPSLVGD
jgi:hypothetical protein